MRAPKIVLWLHGALQKLKWDYHKQKIRFLIFNPSGLGLLFPAQVELGTAQGEDVSYLAKGSSEQNCVKVVHIWAKILLNTPIFFN